MASIRSLWTGLVVLGVLGVLGVLQMGAQAQVSMQPDFQQDKVARSSAVLHRPERHVEGSRQRRARGRIPHRHSPALAPELRDSNPFCPLAPLRGAKASPPGKELGGRWLFFWTQTWLQGKRLVLRFMGRWFSAGLASNSSWFREKKATMSMCSTVVAPSADGGLNLTSTFLRKDQCETRTMQLQPTGTPGSYSYHSPRWGRTSLISVVEINYDEYALVDTKGVDHDFRMATLYSRTQTPRAELKEKFSTFCEAQGFTEDTIVFLPQTDKCLKEEE